MVSDCQVHRSGVIWECADLKVPTSCISNNTASVSGSFDQLDSGDVALDGPGAPWIPKGVRDRVQVIGHTRRQTRERLQVAGRRIKQPLLEGSHVQVVECSTEALNELVAGVEQRVRCQDTLEIVEARTSASCCRRASCWIDQETVWKPGVEPVLRTGRAGV
jgi:hypothetical protein